MPKLSDEVLTLIRRAVDSKINVDNDLTAAEEALGGGELSEYMLAVLIADTKIKQSSQLTDEQLENWVLYVFDKEPTGSGAPATATNN